MDGPRNTPPVSPQQHSEAEHTTAVKLDGKTLAPHNRISFGGKLAGVAARGHINTSQTELLFKTALQEGCNSIVNLLIPLENMNSGYPPGKGQTATYGDITVTTRDDPEIDMSTRFCDEFQVSTEGEHKQLHYSWLGSLSNHSAGSPEDLLKLSAELPPGPALVHCKMGEGRTALFMLVHELRSRVAEGLTEAQLVPSVFQMIQDGRQCRGTFLENEQQLQTVLQAGARLLKISDERLYELIEKAQWPS